MNRFLPMACMVLMLAGCTGAITITGDILPTGTAVRTPLPLTKNTSLPTEIPTSLPTATQSDNHALVITEQGNVVVERYGLLELSLQTNLKVANPYDPDEINIQVRFIAPSGRQIDAGAFWYQDYDFQTRQPSGEPCWKVRFTPNETGTWTATAYIAKLDLRSEPFSFNVSASSRAGFVRINPSNPRYLAYDNGDFFFPIGLNMGWWGGCCDPIDQYGRWLDEFTLNGGNTIRVWMAAWSFGIEWKDTGLGNYDNRQYEAWLLDQLFHLAEMHNVKIVLVLVNHGPFSLATNMEWKDNPYNASLGGPLSSPEQFVTNKTAISYFERRLNYIVNRWGYSPNLLAWEWFNEVNLTTILDETLTPWLREMSAYLHQRDVNHHLTTISYAMRTDSPSWQLPELDIVQKHEYSSQISASDHDLAGRAAQDFQAFAQTIPPKPILMGEFGYSSENYGDDCEKTGIQLHNGLWATTFSGYAGSGMYWWWDTYVEANNLWYHFNGLARFLNGEDLSAYQPFSPLQVLDAMGNPGQVDSLGMSGKNTLVWLRSDRYTVQASIAARNGSQGSSTYVPPLLEGLSLSLDDIMDGNYTVYWYDPQTAAWLGMAIVTAQNQTLTISIPPFREDLAAKIIKNP